MAKLVLKEIIQTKLVLKEIVQAKLVLKEITQTKLVLKEITETKLVLKKITQTKLVLQEILNVGLLPNGSPMNPLKTPIPSLLLVRVTLDSKTVPNLRTKFNDFKHASQKHLQLNNIGLCSYAFFQQLPLDLVVLASNRASSTIGQKQLLLFMNLLLQMFHQGSRHVRKVQFF